MNGNGKGINKTLVQVIAWLALVTLLLVKDILPARKSVPVDADTLSKVSDTVSVNSGRLSRLEGTLDAELASIKSVLEKIDLKIDKHMGIR